MPDLLKLLAELHPTLPVKTTKLKCDTETEVMDLGTYYSKVIIILFLPGAFLWRRKKINFELIFR